MAGAAAVNAGVDVSAGQRRAALTLHALAPGDREWMLAQLPLPASTALRGLLAELQGLGIPADAEVIRAALAEAGPDVLSSVAHARAHAEVLAQEAESFRGVLLSLLAADQRAAVLAHWPLTVDARPVPVARPALTARLQAALLKSWLDLAVAHEGRA